MDYRIHRTPEELHSTGFIEICPWKFSGMHWQKGCLFIWEGSFCVAEGIVARRLPSYAPFSPNDIPLSIGAAIIADWEAVAQRLPSLTSREAAAELNIPDGLSAEFCENFDEHRLQIVTMLLELAQDCRRFYAESEWVCILGV